MQWPADTYLKDISFRVMFFSAAVLAGWICQRWLEGLAWRALGLSFHVGWLRDLLIGSGIGGASLAIAGLLALVTGGLHFTFSGTEVWLLMARTLGATAVLFVIGALAEEATFRG